MFSSSGGQTGRAPTGVMIPGAV